MRNPIETERLILRDPIESDALHLYLIFSDSTAMKYFGPERPFSLQETRNWVTGHARLLDAEGFAPWVVALKATKEIIGWGGLTRSSQDEKPMNELIYIIHPGHWKKGYGSELANFSLKYGFRHLQLRSIETTVRPANAASIKILEKIGMTRTGYDEESNRFHYCILREEWEKGLPNE